MLAFVVVALVAHVLQFFYLHLSRALLLLLFSLCLLINSSGTSEDKNRSRQPVESRWAIVSFWCAASVASASAGTFAEMSSVLGRGGDAIEMSTLELQPAQRLYPRLRELLDFYRSQFGSVPGFFVRMPGRVNIIGEHVDYCGYPVLPMAIDQCILLAVGHSDADSFLQLRNVNAGKYENFKCDLKAINIDLPQQGGPEWYKYFLCGVKGVYEALGDAVHPTGMSVALSGNIPPASGLSSSSALVGAAVLATAQTHRFALDRKQLASISARCERYIGTQGGGMDQAIAYLAQAGCAQFIEFHPELNATPIRLPAGACFIVANSLAEKNKAASSDFNERVVECRLAARVIAKSQACNNWRDMTRFVQLQEVLKCDLTQLEALALQCLTKDVYRRDELCPLLDVTEQEFEHKFLTANTRHMTKFKLRQRALHVIQESLRVAEFRAICEQTHIDSQCNGVNGNSKSATANSHSDQHKPKAAREVHSTLSRLMRQSHRSLKELYECSHPDLDRLVAISDAAGVGARLTGAGWGGCIVALCDSVETSKSYIQQLKEKYFAQLPAHLLERHQPNDFDDVVFATFPGNGAEMFTVAGTAD